MQLGDDEAIRDLRRKISKELPAQIPHSPSDDEAVRDIKRTLKEREREDRVRPWTRTLSEPILDIKHLHPDVGTFRDIAQPGGFRREHILRTAIEAPPDDHPAHKAFLDSLLNPVIRQSLPGTPRGGSSDLATVLLFIKSTVGGTLIVIPGAFKDTGIVVAPAMLVFLGTVEIYCMVLLIRCYDKLRGASYGEVAFAAVGSFGRVAVEMSLFLSQIGFVCTEMLYVAKNGSSALHGLGWANAPPVGLLLVFQLVITIPMSWIRKLEYFKTTNFLANFFVLLSLLVLLFVALHGLWQHGVAENVKLMGNRWPLFAGTSVFAFECINFVIPMYEAHANKHTFVPILVGSLGGVCCLFIVFGGVNYMCYGSSTKSVLTKNLVSDSLPAKAVPLVFSVASMFTVPLLLFPAAILVESYAFRNARDFGSRTVKKNMLRSVLVVFAAIVSAIGKDSIEAFVSIVGSFCCVPLAFIWPCICHLRICKPNALAAAVDYVVAFMGICIFLVTTGFAFDDLVQHERDIRAPDYYFYYAYYA